ncbi:APC family permease [Brevibacillus ginsengisoli]|uniref:APC family permease n=1 Tax=Brevibacillus ginsengisoli TaxID=363854 RepID=UPI003CF8C66D
MQTDNKAQLKKDVGLTLAISLVIGTVIGSGVFMKPGKVIEYTGDSSMALWAWVLGGIITLASGLTIAEVSTQIPKTGGLYVYLEEVYGKIWGYLCGWVQTVIYGPSIIGALGLYFGSLLANLFSWGDEWKLPLGIAAVVFLALINGLGTKYGGYIQTAATIGKLIPIALIIVFGIWMGNSQVLHMPSGLPATHISMGAAILATLWAYDGWMLVGFVAGEMKDPGKILPRAIIGGLSIVTAAYLLVNIALMHILPADQIAALKENAASTAATMIFGDVGGKLIGIGILVSIFGCLNGKILSFPRVPYAMAERGQLPASGLLSQVHPRFNTPVASIILQVIIATILMVMSNPDHLSDIAIFSVYLFNIQAFAAVFILRKRNKGAKRVFSVPLYPIIPVVAIIGAAYIIVSAIMDNPADMLSAIAITVIGLPVYWLINRRKQQQVG